MMTRSTWMLAVLLLAAVVPGTSAALSKDVKDRLELLMEVVEEDITKEGYFKDDFKAATGAEWHGAAPAVHKASWNLAKNLKSAKGPVLNFKKGKNRIVILHRKDEQMKAPEVPDDEDTCDCGIPYGGFSSGVVATTKKFKYGYFESTVKVTGPSNAHTKAAFWLQGDGGELNVGDVLHGSNSVEQNYHCWDPTDEKVDVMSHEKAIETDQPDGKEHTYGLLWEQKKLTYFRDGKVTKSIASTDLEKAKRPLFEACLAREMHLIFSTESHFNDQDEVDAAQKFTVTAEFGSTNVQLMDPCYAEPGKTQCNANAKCSWVAEEDACGRFSKPQTAAEIACGKKEWQKQCKNTKGCAWKDGTCGVDGTAPVDTAPVDACANLGSKACNKKKEDCKWFKRSWLDDKKKSCVEKCSTFPNNKRSKCTKAGCSWAKKTGENKFSCFPETVAVDKCAKHDKKFKACKNEEGCTYKNKKCTVEVCADFNDKKKACGKAVSKGCSYNKGTGKCSPKDRRRERKLVDLRGRRIEV